MLLISRNFIQGEWGGLYYSPVPTSAKLKNVTLTSQTGDLDDLTWIEAPILSASKNVVQVCMDTQTKYYFHVTP